MGDLFKYADDSNIISPVWKDEDDSGDSTAVPGMVKT